MFYTISKSGSKCSKRFHISYLLRLFNSEYLKDVPDIEPISNQTNWFNRHSRNKSTWNLVFDSITVKLVTQDTHWRFTEALFTRKLCTCVFEKWQCKNAKSDDLGFQEKHDKDERLTRLTVCMNDLQCMTSLWVLHVGFFHEWMAGCPRLPVSM